ncbi:hypothetical protein C0J52_20583 [Blattella germanica]|nr:hypothetical protein C0J52_20583 [Blattella germanica]
MLTHKACIYEYLVKKKCIYEGLQAFLVFIIDGNFLGYQPGLNHSAYRVYSTRNANVVISG